MPATCKAAKGSSTEVPRGWRRARGQSCFLSPNIPRRVMGRNPHAPSTPAVLGGPSLWPARFLSQQTLRERLAGQRLSCGNLGNPNPNPNRGASPGPIPARVLPGSGVPPIPHLWEPGRRGHTALGRAVATHTLPARCKQTAPVASIVHPGTPAARGHPSRPPRSLGTPPRPRFLADRRFAGKQRN